MAGAGQRNRARGSPTIHAAVAAWLLDTPLKALIFAAGLGERMRPLTDRTPKPLLQAGGKALIEWHLRRLAAAGVDEVVVNTAWLAEQFPATLGDGSRWGLRLTYSHEGATALETGGGMLKALALLGDAPFISVNGDIWSDFDFSRLPAAPLGDAHLVMVDNPVQHPRGDFALDADGLLHEQGSAHLTFSGIGLYRPQLLSGWRDIIGETPDAHRDPPRFKLAPLLYAAMAASRITGEHHRGRWTDVGTPQRLQQLDTELAGNQP